MTKKINYQTELESLLKNLDYKPKLLLHVCCGPCSSYVMEYLCKYFEIKLFYYNPNIYPESEYNRRKEELKKLITKFPPAVENNIFCQETEYNPQEYFDAIKINENPELADENEKGERCRRCYEFRMKKAYDYAAENGYEYFCTSLSISPFKDSEKINQIGKELTENNSGGPKWLYSDFKKKGGFLRSLELSKEYDMYRQQYCGCVYSYLRSTGPKKKEKI